MTTAAAFDEFDSSLNLDPDERGAAQKFHEELSGFLKEQGLIQSAFLQGSFARRTMLSPLRDIDKVVVLKDDYRHLLGAPDGAQATAGLFEVALQDGYPDASIGRARHAIQLDLGEDTFSFDVVPAFESEDDSDDVLIMDLGKSLIENGWERSNTRSLIRVVAERNGICGASFIHAVRHAKQFVRVALSGRLPGLHVEALAYACMDVKLPYAEAAAQILACGSELLDVSRGYHDPTGRERLSDKLDLEDRLTAQQVFAKAARQAQDALEHAAQGDEDGAVAIWRDIFGDPFPAERDRERKFLSGLYAGVGAAAAVPHVRPTRAWSTT